jgi:urease accessory protein
VRARASIVADSHRGATRLLEMRSEAPLIVRQTDDAVYLVGGAAGPLGGDELEIDVRVGDHAHLAVRSAAATLAQPHRDGGRSVLRTHLVVGAAASLSFRPEPIVSVRGSDHTTDTRVDLAADATLVLGEDLVLGRHDEVSGRLRTRLHVVRDGRTVLLHELDLGGAAVGWSSGAVIGDARALVSLTVIGPTAPTSATSVVDRAARTSAAWLPVAPGVAMLLGLGPSLLLARRAAATLG